ncbi:MAG TPA: hypothetical protein VIY98_09610 [Nitrososphaeraceae archaeon]
MRGSGFFAIICGFSISCCSYCCRSINICWIAGIEFAILLGTLRDTYRLPTEAKVKKVVPVATKPLAKSYKDEDYSF